MSTAIDLTPSPERRVVVQGTPKANASNKDNAITTAQSSKAAEKDEQEVSATTAPPVVEDSGPTVSVDVTKDLWQNITTNVKDASVEVTETSLLMVGASGSGKTTLLHRIYSSFNNASAGSGAAGKKVKPTTALDYSFARRSDRNVSQVAHFWELAQGTELAQLADVVVTAENVHAVVCAVVVDASPSGLPVAWETATYWLKRLDRRVSEIAEKMKAKGSSTPDKMLQRAHKAIGGDGHPDLKRMRLSGVPTVLVINKMDSFKSDTQQLRCLTNAFRFLAHIYGAHLIFTSEVESNRWRALMSHILFQSPFDSKYIQFDPEKGGVLLTADKDTFAGIGDPDVANYSSGGRSGATTGDADLDRWKEPFDLLFPPEKLREESRLLDDAFIKQLYSSADDGFGEATIDALRRQKDEELEQYRKSAKNKKDR